MSQSLVDEILDLENLRLSGRTRRDLAVFDQVYDDGAIFVHSTGRTEDKAEILHDWKEGPNRSYELGAVDISAWGDCARLVGDVLMTMTPSDAGIAPVSVRMMTTRIAIRRDGAWRYVLVHATRMPE